MTDDVAIDFLLPLILLAIGAIAGFGGISRFLLRRMISVLVLAVAAGAVARVLGLPLPPPDTIEGAARFGLAIAAFFAAQQCRLSRLRRISPPVLWLTLLAAPTGAVVFGLAMGAVLPNLPLASGLLVGVALVLGSAPIAAAPLLSAPVREETKAAARLESGVLLTVGIPVALFLQSATIPIAPDMPVTDIALFSDLAGFTVGGTIGLLAGRFLPNTLARSVAGALLVAALTWVLVTLLGFDQIIGVAAAGILFSEESSLTGQERTRQWRRTEIAITPLAVIAFAFLLGPYALPGTLLSWVFGLIALTVTRAIPRHLVLTGVGVPDQDRRFLVWYSSAPGLGAALLILLYWGSGLEGIDSAIGVAAVAVLVGIISVRLSAKLLLRQLVQRTARARKHRFYAP